MAHVIDKKHQPAKSGSRRAIGTAGGSVVPDKKDVQKAHKMAREAIISRIDEIIRLGREGDELAVDDDPWGFEGSNTAWWFRALGERQLRQLKKQIRKLRPEE